MRESKRKSMLKIHAFATKKTLDRRMQYNAAQYPIA